jgi:hypothetical protein
MSRSRNQHVLPESLVPQNGWRFHPEDEYDTGATSRKVDSRRPVVGRVTQNHVFPMEGDFVPWILNCTLKQPGT